MLGGSNLYSLRQFQRNKNRIGCFQGVYLDVRSGLVDIVKSDNFDYFYIILLLSIH